VLLHVEAQTGVLPGGLILHARGARGMSLLIEHGGEFSGTSSARAHRRGRRLLLIFLAASAALHAAALTVVPPLMRDGALAKVSALEVVILKPQPPPMTPPAPAVPPPPQSLRKIVPEPAVPKKPAQAPPVGQRPAEPVAPMLALPDSRPPAEGAYTVPPEKHDETRAMAPEPGNAGVDAPLVPPALNSAYLRNPAPRYPLIARRNGEQGTVTLRLLVTREGVPVQVSVEKSSGSVHLDGAALDAVKTWRFVPARRGTEAVEAWVLVPVVFKLEGVS
jgi:protein TonB